MAQNDLEARHLNMLDRDLGRFSTLERTTVYISGPLAAPGIALIFTLLAGLGAMAIFEQPSSGLIVTLAAVFGGLHG